MRRAGYVSFGPFAFGGEHDSRGVERLLGDIGLRWVETAHFRIGSALPPIRYPRATKRKREARARFLSDWKLLRERLPRLPARPQDLDRWLVLHLYAIRLEALYADFAQRLGVRDEDFPKHAGERGSGGRYMGEGPFLGQPGKYLVLLLDSRSSLERYLQNVVGERLPFPKRHHFRATGNLCFVTARHANHGSYLSDRALHAHVVAFVVHNLVDGYRYYAYDLPVWWTEGLAHWYARRVDPRQGNFTQRAGTKADIKRWTDWDSIVRQLVAHDGFRPAPEMLRLHDIAAFCFEDHLVAWSRVDFLMHERPRGLATYMNALKGRFDERGYSSDVGLLDAQGAAMSEAWGLAPTDFDRAWSAFVRDTYPETGRKPAR